MDLVCSFVTIKFLCKQKKTSINTKIETIINIKKNVNMPCIYIKYFRNNIFSNRINLYSF